MFFRRPQNLRLPVLFTAVQRCAVPGRTLLCAGLCAGLYAATASGVSNAAEPGKELFELELEDLLKVQVSVASAREESLLDTPAQVSRFDADEARALGLHTLGEWLAFLPGIDVVDTAIGSPAVMIRGLGDAFNQKVLFLLDETPYWMPSHGNIPLAGLPLELISHVEVIRGPGAVIYGTNASAGVIKVVTRRNGERHASLRAGPRNAASADLLYSAGDRDSHWTFAAAGMDDDGYPGLFRNRPRPGNQPDASADGEIRRAQQMRSVFLRWRDDAAPWRQEAVLQAFDSTRSGLAGPASINNRSALEEAATLFSYRADTDWRNWQLHWQSSYNAYTLELPTARLINGSVDGVQTFDGRDHNRRLRHHLQGDTETVYGRWQVGADWEQRETGDYLARRQDNGSIAWRQMPADKLVERAIYGQWQQDFQRWQPLLGLRLVDSSQFGRELMPRAALLWRIDDLQSIKLLHSNAYNAPTFLQLNINIPPNAVVGDPALAPERIRSNEIVYTRVQAPWRASFSVYHVAVHDLIERVTLTPGQSRYRNADAFMRRGAESELYWRRGSTSAYVHLAWQHDSDRQRQGDALAAVTPRWLAQFGGRWQYSSQHEFGAALLLRAAHGPVAQREHLHLQYRYTRGDWQFSATLVNALGDDETAADVQDTVSNRVIPGADPEPGFWLGLRYRQR